MDQPRTTNGTASPWPHRVAVLLACATFPLIWVGGLVTTYEAGMAVPDWPTTYGYNMFLYPWQTWFWGPWDLFIEHGHRLFGATVGLLTILVVGSAFYSDRRVWYRWATLGALALVIFQGVLGGLRVRLDQRLLAQIHGCTGPVFFALAVALAVWTSPRWLAGAEAPVNSPRSASAARFRRLAFLTVLFAYVQLVLGSQLRHIRPGVDMATFRAAVWMHLLMAGIVAVHVLLLALRAVRSFAADRFILVPALALAGLLLLQLSLGAGAWVVNYGFPAWLGSYSWAQVYTVEHESRMQAAVTTAHVATGSLILVTALTVALRSLLLPAGLRQATPKLSTAGVLV